MTSNLEMRARRAVQEAGFATDFPDLQRELDAARAKLQSSTRFLEALETSDDLRALLWSSIDNDSSRDLDQIEFAQRLPNGAIQVQIALADVDEFVPKGSRLDEIAAQNTTSVYTGIETFPMLPREISEDLSSLLPDRDRLALVVAFEIDQSGEVGNVQLSRALVRNLAKLTYDEIGDWLDEQNAQNAETARDSSKFSPQNLATQNSLDAEFDAPNFADANSPDNVKSGEKSSTRIAEMATISGLREQILLQNEAAICLQSARERSGALDLESLEVTPQFENGRVVDLKMARKNAARRIIENFMVAANMAMANFLPSRGFSELARVVREPERWPRIREIAQQNGDDLPPAPDPRALSAFLERRRKAAPEIYAQLSLSVLKLLGPGRYELVRPQDREGHFGLGAARYTHSTAPNRRYPDLVTQRLLKAALQNAPAPYSDDELAQIAAHCNEREAAAQKVERLMRKVAAAALFGDRIGQNFDGVVTGASSKGVWVRTLRPPVEGRILQGDAGLQVGDRVRVKLLHTDVERGFIDFARA